MISFGRRATILGVSLEPHETVVCRMRRQGNKVVASAALRVPVAASLFKTAPERAGQELRNHLQAAGFRAEPCLICLPLCWAFTAEVDLPDLAEADLQSFIHLEAERRFPLAPDDLALAVSRPPAGGERNTARHRLLVGVPSECLSNVARAFRAARMRPLSLTFGAVALADEHANEPCALILAGRGFVEFIVATGHRPPILRNVAWSDDASREEAMPDERELARQLRITLAQLEPAQRELVTTATLYGDDVWHESGKKFSSLNDSLAKLGIALKSRDATGEVPPALSAAATQFLSRGATTIELTSKRKSQLPTLAARFSARNVRLAVGGVCAVIVAVVAAFGLQARELAQLEEAWGGIAPQVEKARLLQDRVRKYREWYDNGVPSLAIPMWLTTAFPGEGSVWIKTLHVKDRTLATCSGVAANRDAWMEVMERLGKNKDIDDLQVVQTRGDAPFSFTLTFRRKGGAGGF